MPSARSLILLLVKFYDWFSLSKLARPLSLTSAWNFFVSECLLLKSSLTVMSIIWLLKFTSLPFSESNFGQTFTCNVTKCQVSCFHSMRRFVTLFVFPSYNLTKSCLFLKKWHLIKLLLLMFSTKDFSIYFKNLIFHMKTNQCFRNFNSIKLPLFFRSKWKWFNLNVYVIKKLSNCL